MTYSVLMDVASQREHEIAARARLPRLDSEPETATTRRTGKRDRAGAAFRLRARVIRG
jgi:hypothetical protein